MIGHRATTNGSPSIMHHGGVCLLSIKRFKGRGVIRHFTDSVDVGLAPENMVQIVDRMNVDFVEGMFVEDAFR